MFYIIVLFFCLFMHTAAVHAQTIPATELSGFAWSSNIGWISLNCKNDSNCAASDYRVTINADRTITGWGWSSNIGWIKFGDLSAFPAGGGTTARNAEITGTYPNLTWQGWARACAATADRRCGSMSTGTNTGGWDGWIALRGTNFAVSANMTTGMNTNSYAWGGDVVGWVDMFSNISFTTVDSSLSGTGCTIPLGSGTCGTTLTWDVDSSLSSPNLYRATTPTGQLSTSRYDTNFPVTLSHGYTTFHLRSGTTILTPLTVQARCAAGLTYNGSTCIVGTGTTSPSITLKAVPPIVRTGGRTSVEWTLSTLSGSTCVLNGPGLSNVTISTLVGSTTTGVITSTATVRLTCTGAYGSVDERATVEVIPVAEEV